MLRLAFRYALHYTALSRIASIILQRVTLLLVLTLRTFTRHCNLRRKVLIHTSETNLSRSGRPRREQSAQAGSIAAGSLPPTRACRSAILRSSNGQGNVFDPASAEIAARLELLPLTELLAEDSDESASSS